MKKIENKLRKSLRRVFNGISLTAVAFIFQACYGTGPDMYCDVKLTGTVVSKTTNLPIQGIKVTVNEGSHNLGFTDENGKFDFYVSVDMVNHLNVHFHNVDGDENGYFSDTTITVEAKCKDELKLNVALEEKE